MSVGTNGTTDTPKDVLATLCGWKPYVPRWEYAYTFVDQNGWATADHSCLVTYGPDGWYWDVEKGSQTKQWTYRCVERGYYPKVRFALRKQAKAALTALFNTNWARREGGVWFWRGPIVPLFNA